MILTDLVDDCFRIICSHLSNSDIISLLFTSKELYFIISNLELVAKNLPTGGLVKLTNFPSHLHNISIEKYPYEIKITYSNPEIPIKIIKLNKFLYHFCNIFSINNYYYFIVINNVLYENFLKYSGLRHKFNDTILFCNFSFLITSKEFYYNLYSSNIKYQSIKPLIYYNNIYIIRNIYNCIYIIYFDGDIYKKICGSGNSSTEITKYLNKTQRYFSKCLKGIVVKRYINNLIKYFVNK